MHTAKPCLFLIIIVLFWSTACFAEEDILFTSEYSGKHSGLTVNLTKSLTQVSEHQYVLTSKASNFLGSLIEESHFLIMDSMMVPVSYRYYRKIFGKKSDQRLIFDWQSSTASFTRSDKPKKNKTFKVSRDILDPSLYQLKLQQELFEQAQINPTASDHFPLENEQTFRYNYAKGGGVREIEFATKEPSQYVLGGEAFSAITVERINQRKNKQSIITVVPEMNYQIAEILHIDEDGKKHRVKLVAYDANQDLMRAFYSKLVVKESITTKENLPQDKDNSL